MYQTDKSKERTERRQPTWNSIQPQDNYDIRRSMIQSLPGSKHKFMGQNLGLVCLLQAAEIERLCESLTEYQLKYREVRKFELDRHSYEVQIKELAKQKPQDDSLREVKKLKEFINKQNIEMQELRKNGTFQNDLSLKYQGTLLQLDSLSTQYTSLKIAYESTIESLQQSKIQMSVLESAKNKEIERIRQVGSGMERDTITRLEQQLTHVENQLRRSKDMIEAKNTEINEQQKKIRRLESDEQQMSESRASVEAAKELKAKTVILGKEIQRLNLVLRDKTNQNKEMYSRSNELNVLYQNCRRELQSKNQQYVGLEAAMHRMELSFRTTQQRLEEEQKKGDKVQLAANQLNTYIQKTRMLSEEVTRLNHILQLKIAQNKRINEVITQQEYSLKSIDSERRQFEELRSRSIDFTRKQAQYQSRISVMNQQRLQLSKRTQEYETNFRRLQQQNISMKSRIQQNEHNTQHISKMTEYQNTIYGLKSSMKEQIQKNNVLEKKVYGYEQKVREYELTINSYERRVQEAEDKADERADSQIPIAQMYQEVQRLNNVLRIKIAQTRGLQEKTIEQDGVLNRYKRQAEDYSKTLRDRDDTLRKAEVEITRLNDILKIKVEQLEALRRNRLHQSKIQGYTKQINELTVQLQMRDNQLINLRNEYQKVQRNDNTQQLRTQLQQLRQKVSTYEKETIDRRHQLQELNDRNIRQIMEWQQRYNSLQIKYFQLDKTVRVSETNSTHYETTISMLQKQKQEADFKIGQLTEIINEYEIQQGSLSQDMRNQNATLRSRIKSLELDIETERRKHSEQSIAWEREFKNKINNIEQQSQFTNFEYNKVREESQRCKDQVNRVKEESRKTVGKYQENLQNLSQELNRVKSILQSKTIEYSSMQQQMEKQKREYESIRIQLSEMSSYSSKVTQYESQLLLLRQQNQRLTSEVSRYDNQLSITVSKLNEYESKHLHTSRAYTELTTNLNEFKAECDRLRRENDNLRRNLQRAQQEIQQTKKRTGAEWQRTKSQYQGTVNKLNAELKKILLESNQLRKKLTELSEVNQKLMSNNQQLTTSTQQISVMQFAMTRLEQQNAHLNDNLKMFQGENDKTKKSIAQYEQELKRANEEGRKVAEELRRVASERAEYGRKVNQLQERLRHQVENNSNLSINVESKLQKAYIQLERLNSVLLHLTEDNKALDSRNKGLLKELEDYRLRVKDFEEVNRRIAEYERRLAALDQQIRRRDQHIRKNEQEIKRRGEEIRKRDQEIRKKIEQFQKLQYAYRTLDQNSKGKMNELIRQIQEINITSESKYRQLSINISEQNRRRSQLQMKLSNASHEIQRLNVVLKNKVQQLNQLNISSVSLRQRYDNLVHQHEQYTSQQRDANERKLRQYHDQIQRLNNTLRLKMQQTVQWEQIHTEFQSKFMRLNQEHDSLKQTYSSTHEDSKRMKQVLIDHRNSINKVSEELERLKSILQQAKRENQSLRREAAGFHDEIDALHKSGDAYRRENDALKRLVQMVKNATEQNNAVQEEIDRLENVRRGHLGQMEDIFSRYEGDLRVPKHSEECMAMLVVLCAEIEALRSRVKDQGRNAGSNAGSNDQRSPLPYRF